MPNESLESDASGRKLTVATKVGLVLLTAVVTGLVSIASTLLVSYLQKSGARLEHQIVSSPALVSEGATRAILQVVLRNPGNSYAEDVTLHIALPEGQIEASAVEAAAGSSIDKSSSADKRTLTVQIPLINPSEEVVAAILVSTDAKGSTEARPTVSARGKGVVSRAQEGSTRNPAVLDVLPSIIAAYVGIVLILSVLRRRWLLPFLGGWHRRHGGDQREVLAYVLSAHGLLDDSERLLQMGSASYWSEADRQAYLAERHPETATARCAALRAVLDYAIIAESSVPIIHCDIARICMVMGDRSSAGKHFEMAMKDAPRLVEARTAIDPILRELSAGSQEA